MLTRCWVEDHWINDQRANPVTSTTIHLVLFEARFIAIKHLFIRTASTTTSAETIIIISITTVIRATLLTAWLFVPLLCALLMVMVLLLFDWCYRMVIFLFKDWLLIDFLKRRCGGEPRPFLPIFFLLLRIFVTTKVDALFFAIFALLLVFMMLWLNCYRGLIVIDMDNTVIKRLRRLLHTLQQASHDRISCTANIVTISVVIQLLYQSSWMDTVCHITRLDHHFRIIFLMSHHDTATVFLQVILRTHGKLGSVCADHPFVSPQNDWLFLLGYHSLEPIIRA